MPYIRVSTNVIEKIKSAIQQVIDSIDMFFLFYHGVNKDTFNFRTRKQKATAHTTKGMEKILVFK